jgi:hypothetical protein
MLKTRLLLLLQRWFFKTLEALVTTVDSERLNKLAHNPGLLEHRFPLVSLIHFCFNNY